MGLCKICLVITVVMAVVFAVGVNWYINQKSELLDLSKDVYWGSAAQKNAKEDTSVREFKISVSEDVLKDLKYRLQNTIYQTDLEDGSFAYGFQVSYMKDIVKYWLNDFDWRKQEELLNTFKHFKTKIEGLDVHFVHAKPKKPTGQVFPILMVHGWPGSFWEFYKIIPMLTEASGDIAFEVICPSIPGFGYSDAPRRTGFDYTDAALVFKKLMERLGYQKYYVQGGDWGAGIAHTMTVAFPDQILGHHTNFFQFATIVASPGKVMLGAWFPSLILEANETTRLYPFTRFFYFLVREIGYNWIQSTKPDTISMGLTDSPVGLAAYILEKFCDGRSNEEWKDGSSKYGEITCDLTDAFTLDELLTNLMIYWTNRNFVSSARLYKELYGKDSPHGFNVIPSDVPAGLAQFKWEAITVPKSLAKNVFTNLVQFTNIPEGGHFAALEQPRLLADDIISFVKKTIQISKKK